MRVFFSISYLFFCIFITSISVAQNQTFPHSGTEIYYSHFQQNIMLGSMNPLYENGYIRAWHVGDTIINNETCRVIRYERQLKDIYFNNGVYTSVLKNIESRGSDIFQTQNDSVFLVNLNNGNKSFYWYNNPQVGDIWPYTVKNPELGLNEKVYLYVKSIIPLSINGYPSKNIELEQCDSLGNIAEVGNGIIVGSDSFGFQYGYKLSQDITINTVMGCQSVRINFDYFKPDFPDEGPIVKNKITCFKSDEVPLFLADTFFTNCLSYISLSNEKYFSNNENLLFYPNPIINQLSILNSSPYSFKTQLFALNGQIVKSDMYIYPHVSTTISLDGLIPGIYILKCSDEKGNVQTHKIVKK